MTPSMHRYVLLLFGCQGRLPLAEVWDGVAFRESAAGCYAPGTERVFAADGAMWIARIVGVAILWQRLDAEQ